MEGYLALRPCAASSPADRVAAFEHERRPHAALGDQGAQLVGHPRLFDVNVKGTLFTVQKALPVLNDGASVIVNGSTSAARGAEGMGANAASKAALRALARTWANELKDRGFRVNVVSPGPTDTSGVVELVGEENSRPTTPA